MEHINQHLSTLQKQVKELQASRGRVEDKEMDEALAGMRSQVMTLHESQTSLRNQVRALQASQGREEDKEMDEALAGMLACTFCNPSRLFFQYLDTLRLFLHVCLEQRNGCLQRINPSSDARHFVRCQAALLTIEFLKGRWR